MVPAAETEQGPADTEGKGITPESRGPGQLPAMAPSPWCEKQYSPKPSIVFEFKPGDGSHQETVARESEWCPSPSSTRKKPLFKPRGWKPQAAGPSLHTLPVVRSNTDMQRPVRAGNAAFLLLSLFFLGGPLILNPVPG